MRLIPFILTLFMFNCHDQGEADFNKCWSIAERRDDSQIFYPCNDERLKPSRFNAKYTFYADNRCEYLALNARDAHSMEEGNYSYDENSSIITVRDSGGELVRKVEVLKISQDELEIKILKNN